MLNKLCSDMIDNAYSTLIEGNHPLRKAAFDFICKMTVSVGSINTRLQFIQNLRGMLHFENTKSSEKQIMFLKFCNYVLPILPQRFVKQHLLEDMLKHAVQHVAVENLEVYKTLVQSQI